MTITHVTPSIASPPSQMSLPASRLPGVPMAVEMSRGGEVDSCVVSTGTALVVLELFTGATAVISGLAVGIDAVASFGAVGAGGVGCCGASVDCSTFC